MREFAVSVLVGTVAAAWMPLMFSVLLVLNTFPGGLGGDGNLFGSFVLAVSPLIISFAFVLTASLAVGLPATALLRRLKAESLRAYVSLGIAAGFLIPLLALRYLNAMGSWWVAPLGAFSGGLTGRTWWFSAREPLIG